MALDLHYFIEDANKSDVEISFLDFEKLTFGFSFELSYLWALGVAVHCQVSVTLTVEFGHFKRLSSSGPKTQDSLTQVRDCVGLVLRISSKI